MKEVIENELKCVQRDCCRLENECAKCDLVLPKEEIVNAYNEALKLQQEIAELKEEMKAKQVVLNDFKSRVETVTDRFDKKSSQLTKAKEIVRDLLNSCFGYNSKTVNYEVKVKAEQFLEDVSARQYHERYEDTE